MEKYKVIILEDDENSALKLNLFFQKHNYNVVAICTNPFQAKNKLSITPPDIAIINISKSESDDGVTLAKFVKNKYNIPFIYISDCADDAILEKVAPTQPDAYLIKPLHLPSLHATMQMALFKYKTTKEKTKLLTKPTNTLNIEKLLHSKKHPQRPIVPFGEDYHLDIEICETFYKEKKLKLTKKENAFLQLLVAQPGSVVSFRQAMNYVWKEYGATQNSVRTLVWRLRNKLETDIIKNASGIGYYIEE